MTLLFFLRSPAGNTDTGQSPDGDVGRYWNYDDVKPKRKKKPTRKELRALALAEAKKKEARLRMIREEEDLLMLFMHEFDGYDD